jgi:hypothetical protein
MTALTQWRFWQGFQQRGLWWWGFLRRGVLHWKVIYRPSGSSMGGAWAQAQLSLGLSSSSNPGMARDAGCDAALDFWWKARSDKESTTLELVVKMAGSSLSCFPGRGAS